MTLPLLSVQFSPSSTWPYDPTPTWVELGDGGPHGNRVLEADWTDGKQANLGQFPPGEATIVLRNDDRLFDPEHQSGTYVGQLNPRVPFRLRATMATLDLDGTAWCRFLDHASLRVLGDLEVVVHLTMDDWTPAATAYTVSKSAGFANSGGYWMGVTATTGYPFLSWSDGTSSFLVTGTVAPSFTNGQPGWLKYTLDVNNGSGGRTISFYSSTDGATWTLLSSTSPAGTTSIGTNVTNGIIGANGFGLGPLAGQIHRVIIRDGIGGTTVLDVPFYAQDIGDQAFLDACGRSCDLNGTAAIAHLGITEHLFLGFVEDGWEQTYQPPDVSTCTVKLVDVVALVANVAMTRTVGSTVAAQETNLGYWMLDETFGTVMLQAEGSALSDNPAPHGVYATGATSLTTEIVTPAGAVYRGLALVGEHDATVPYGYTGTSAGWAALVDLSAVISELTDADLHVIAESGPLGGTGPTYQFGLEIVSKASKTARLYFRSTADLVGVFQYSTPFLVSQPRHVAVGYNSVGPALNFYLDGADIGADTTDPPLMTSSASGLRLFGPKANGKKFRGSIAGVAYANGWTPTQVADLAAGFLAPLDGQTADQHIKFTLNQGGVTDPFLDLDIGETILGPFNPGGSTLDHAQETTAEEQGGLYCAHHDGGKVHLRTRYASFLEPRSTTTMATFSDDPTVVDTQAARVIPGSLVVEPNGVSTIINQANVEWRGGTITVDGDGGAAYGLRPASVTTHATRIGNALGVGQWLVALNAVPRARIKKLGIDPGSNNAEITTALLTRIGDRVAYRSIPQNVGSATTTILEVMGRHHRVSELDWSTEFYLMPAPADTVTLFQLGVSRLGGTHVLAY